MRRVSLSGGIDWRAVLLWNAALLAAGLLVLELAFGDWLAGEQTLPFYVFRNASVSYNCAGLYADCGLIEYSRDRWGLRGGITDPSQVEVLTVGGSTTDQRYLALARTWQATLAQDLERLRGKPVTVANAGLDGMSTVGHLHSLEHWFPKIPGLNPRTVIYFVGINDVELPVDWDVTREVDSPFLRDLKERSALVALLRRIRGLLWARQAGFLPFGHQRVDVADMSEARDFESQVDQYSRTERARIAEYQRRITLVAELTRKRLGARPVFMTQVSAFHRKGDPPLLSKENAAEAIGIAAYNRAMLDACRQGGFACMDLAGEIAFEARDFYDNCHNTPSGAAKIGAFAARKLAAMPAQ